MYGNIGLHRYRETDVNSMSKEKLIVALYEKIIADLEEAIAASEGGRKVDMTQRVNHSQRIVSELRNALDHEIGGDVARNLESIYDYLFHEHLQVLVDRDPSHLRNCLDVLQPLLAAWRQIPAGAGDAEARARQGAGPNPASNETETKPTEANSGQSPQNAPDLDGVLSVSA